MIQDKIDAIIKMNGVLENDSLITSYTGEDFNNTSIIITISRYVIVFITIFGNLLTIMIIVKYEALQTKTNVLIASLAIIDLSTGLFFFASQICEAFISNYWQYGKFCLISIVLIRWPISNSVLHLAFIAIERYVAVLHPLHYHIYITKIVVGLFIVACWVISLVLGASLLSVWLVNFQEGKQLVY